MKVSLLFDKEIMNKNALFNQISDFIDKSKTKEVFVELKELKNARSIMQNRFFHGPVIDGFVRATGDTNRFKMKWVLKEMFLTVHTEENWGVRDTSDLDVDEMREFIDKCIKYLEDELHGWLISTEYEELMRI